MSELIKLSKERKFNLFVALCIAFFAAFSTAFFAVMEGVKNSYTILFRMVVSFSIFAVIGYFLGDFLENEYLNKVPPDVEPKDLAANEEDNEMQPETGEPMDDTEAANESELQANESFPLLEDDSFDKIVVMDDDA